jgi:hypothetical protein
MKRRPKAEWRFSCSVSFHFREMHFTGVRGT